MDCHLGQVSALDGMIDRGASGADVMCFICCKADQQQGGRQTLRRGGHLILNGMEQAEQRNKGCTQNGVYGDVKILKRCIIQSKIAFGQIRTCRCRFIQHIPTWFSITVAFTQSSAERRPIIQNKHASCFAILIALASRQSWVSSARRWRVSPMVSLQSINKEHMLERWVEAYFEFGENSTTSTVAAPQSEEGIMSVDKTMLPSPSLPPPTRHGGPPPPPSINTPTGKQTGTNGVHNGFNAQNG